MGPRMLSVWKTSGMCAAEFGIRTVKCQTQAEAGRRGRAWRTDPRPEPQPGVGMMLFTYLRDAAGAADADPTQ